MFAMQKSLLTGLACVLAWGLNGSVCFCVADTGASQPGSGQIQNQIEEQERLLAKLEGEKKGLEERRAALQAALGGRQRARRAEEAKDRVLAETLATIQTIDEHIDRLKAVAHDARNEIVKSGLDGFRELTERDSAPNHENSTDFDPRSDAKTRPDVSADEESMRIQTSGDSAAILRELSPAIRLHEVNGWIERYENAKGRASGLYQRQAEALRATERFATMLADENRISREIAAVAQAMSQRDSDIARIDQTIKGLKRRLDAAVVAENGIIRNTLATIEALEKRIQELTRERERIRLAEQMSRWDANIEQHRTALQREQAKYDRQFREHVAETAQQARVESDLANQPPKPPVPRTMTCPRCRSEVPHVSNTPLCNACTPPVMSDYGTYYFSRGQSGGKEKAFHSMLPANTRAQIERDQDRLREQFQRAGPFRGGMSGSR